MATPITTFGTKPKILFFPDPSNPSAWPKAPSNSQFIFGAIQTIGSALHGPEWTGVELAALDWPESPKAELTRTELSAERRRQLVPQRGLASVIAKPEAGAKAGAVVNWPEGYISHVKLWYLEKRERAWEENRAAKQRLESTVEWLAQKCRDGHLIAFARLRPGGVLWPMKATEWNRDDVFHSFVKTGGHKRYFRELQNSGPFEVFLFFDRASVEAEVAILANVPVTLGTVDLAKLSPYLQLAVKVALAKRYEQGGTMDSAAVREAEVKAAWSNAMGDIPMSDPPIRAIAKVIGFPNPVAIQQGRSAAATRKGGATPKAQ